MVCVVGVVKQVSGVGSNFSMGGFQLGKENMARDRQDISLL